MKSLQDILRRRQQEEFVGREEQLAFFRHNLRYAPDDDRRRFVINISGQGGVGKTWLLRRFCKIAEEVGAITAYTNEAENDVLGVLACIAEQCKVQGYTLKVFTKRHDVYRQRRQDIMVDSGAPSRFVKPLAQGMVRATRRIPFAGIAAEFVEEEPFAEQVGEFAAYVAGMFGSHEDARLVLEPVEVLTPLLVADVRKVVGEHLLVLFFDTYEHTDSFLDDWLRDLLEGRYGSVPASILLVIAGRDELDRNLWAPYEGLLARLSLDPFCEEEVLDYLARKGVTDEQVVEIILHLSGRLPLLVATLAAEHPDDPVEMGDPSGEAVERFLKWVEDPRQRQVALDAALPRRLNRDVLAVLVGEEEADPLFAWLRNMPFVEKRGDGWAYHDVVRAQMLRYKQQESPRGWAELHRQLAEYYSGLRDSLKLEEGSGREDEIWQGYALETLYHQLCWASHRYITPALNGLVPILNDRGPLARLWSKVILQAGEDTGVERVQELGWWLVTGFQAYDMALYEEAISHFSSLVDCPELDPEWRPAVLDWQGDLYYLAGQYDQALAKLKEAIQLQPEMAEYWAHRGVVYRAMRQYEDALAAFNRAIDLDPEYAWAIARRAEVYRGMGHYKKALLDCDRAIEFQRDLARATASRGATYRLMECYDKALADLNCAIEIQPDYAWALGMRGVTYSEMGRFDEAIADFNRAIESEPDLTWVFNSRAEAYRRMGCYGDALADFDRAIELRTDLVWAFARRGATYAMIRRYNDALADLNYAIGLQPDLAWAFARRGEVYRRIRRYDEALVNLNRSIELEPDSEWHRYGRAIVYQAQGRTDEARADLATAIQLGRQRCEKHPQDWRHAFRLAIYHLAAGKSPEAYHLYRQILSSETSLYHICEAIFDLEDFLTLFPDHLQARAMRELLQEHLQQAKR